MLRLPLLGSPILRYLLVLLIALAPFGAARATVSVSGDMGGTVGQVSCSSASSIAYTLDQNVFSFFCGTTGLTYACSPSNVDYGTGTQAIALTCLSNTGSAVGLTVNAIMDGVQNGNGNSDGICNNASSFQFHVTERRYTWTCNNGNGNNNTVSCWTSGMDSSFALVPNEVNMDCVVVVWRSDFEDFEPGPSEYSDPHLE
jgi:hypothetical protein